MELLNDEVKTKIYEIRGVKVMLDKDLAELYEVETKYLNRQVKRNIKRFEDEDFMFQITDKELENLRCQIGTTNLSMIRSNPFVFTEQGVYMLATVINSKIAIDITKTIMRTFTKMREFALNYKDIVIELQNIKEELKSTKENGEQNSQHIKTAFELLSQILDDTSKTNKNLIGFRPKDKDKIK
ncbi:MAG: ORF6N domain-containing protein [Campylobacterota bacterium]|nr:ORF6N domain-containing protein [Campylobacterota bacterium]